MKADNAVQPTENEQVRDVDSEAAAWAARLDARPGEPMPDLDDWLARDPRRSGALLRAQAILDALGGEGTETGEPAGQSRDTILSIAMSLSSARRWRMASSGALATIAAAVALFFSLDDAGQVYETQTGEIKQIALADGSAMSIDARSRLEVDYDSSARRIRMENGRVIFRAAKADPRPFVVEVGAVTITDIGTEFQVFDDPASDAIEVLVTEGVVEVATGSERLRMTAGQRLKVSRSGVQTVHLKPELLPTRDMLRTTAWREGRLELDGETLSEAVAQLNRTNQLQIVIADPALGSKELFGTFQTSDPRGFAQAIAVSLDTSITERGGVIVIGS
ncbi:MULTISPECIES: FecR domain-containing protein [Sphingomonadaceae]|jgi:transmembrane sensor|uniref:FecR family protein n=1 Tax=Sphingomonadales TaxID=204457 RepID=UPI00083420C4|nr:MULTISPECIES: FecR domain-containing protein [Sphingomonadaceae]